MEIKALYKKFLKHKGISAPKNKVQSKKPITVSNVGLWDKSKKKVIVPSNRITMKGPKGEQDFFKRPVLATGLQSGKQVMMQPGREYYFPEDKAVFEKRMQSGGLFAVGPYDEMMAPKQGNYLLPDINRPSYRDEEGGRRSEYRVGVNIDGEEVLFPTVVGGRQLTDDQAEAQYEKTGLHMGKFKTPEEAEYASRLRTARYNMLEDPVRFSANQFQGGGTVKTSMVEEVNQEDSIPVLLDALFSQYQKTKEAFGVEEEEDKVEMQDGAETSTEQNPDRISQVNIKSKQDPWYKRYPRMVGRAIDDRLSDFGHQYAQRISSATGGSEWYKQSNPFMNVALESMNAPQLAATYAVTGKVQTPSEAMDIQNPYGAFAVDALLDPAVAFGVGKGLTRGFKKIKPKSILGEFNTVSKPDFDIHDVRLKYHNNVALTTKESDMLAKFGKGNKANYIDAEVNDIVGELNTKDLEYKTKLDEVAADRIFGKEQPKVSIPEETNSPFQINVEQIDNGLNISNRDIDLSDLVDDLPPTYPGPYQRSANSRAADRWLEDWFYSPTTKEKFTAYGGNERDWQNIMNSLENPIKSNYVWGKNQPGGQYHSLIDQASIPVNAPVDVGVHEGVHKTKLLLSPNKPVLPRLWNDFTDAVRLTPSEAYPEIFRLRQKMGLKPGQTITLEDLNQNLKEINNGYMLPMKVKDKNKLLDILNKAPALAPIGAGIGVGASQVNKKKSGMQMGGMSIPGVNGTVVANTNAPSLYKKYKRK